MCLGIYYKCSKFTKNRSNFTTLAVILLRNRKITTSSKITTNCSKFTIFVVVLLNRSKITNR